MSDVNYFRLYGLVEFLYHTVPQDKETSALCLRSIEGKKDELYFWCGGEELNEGKGFKLHRVNYEKQTTMRRRISSDYEIFGDGWRLVFLNQYHYYNTRSFLDPTWLPDNQIAFNEVIYEEDRELDMFWIRVSSLPKKLISMIEQFIPPRNPTTRGILYSLRNSHLIYKFWYPFSFWVPKDRSAVARRVNKFAICNSLETPKTHPKNAKIETTILNYYEKTPDCSIKASPILSPRTPQKNNRGNQTMCSISPMKSALVDPKL